MNEPSEVLAKDSSLPSAALKKITHTFLSGKVSATIILPIGIARKYGLDKPSNVVVEEMDTGILIRRIDV
jgi:hypothetical protein